MWVNTLSKYIDTGFIFSFIKHKYFTTKKNRLVFLVIKGKLRLMLGCVLETVIRSFINLIDVFFFGITKGYKIFLDIKGTGYKLRLVWCLNIFGLIMRLGFSHLIHVRFLSFFRVYFFSRVSLCFFSSDACLLSNKIHSIRVQKKLNYYKGKGLLSKGSVIKLKKSTKLRF